MDVVIRIRPEAYQAPFASLAADVDRVIVQLHQWRAGETGPEVASADRSAGEPSNDT
jgi:hypothetical protein